MDSLESVFTQSQNMELPDDLSLDSVISITSSNAGKVIRTNPSPPLSFNSQHKKSKNLGFDHLMSAMVCEEVIEIDDDSNDKIPNGHTRGETSNNRCSPLRGQDDDDIMADGLWEEVDVKYHNGGPPTSSELELQSPESPKSLVIASPEHHMTSQYHATSPEPLNDGELVIDVPRVEIEGIPQTGEDNQIENEAESIISINSDSDSDDLQFPLPHWTECGHSANSKEHYHRHLCSADPHSGMSCTECSYSAGCEKCFLSHMAATHCIKEPEFYKSNDQQYVCRICKLTQATKSGMGSHIKNSHKTRYKVLNERILPVKMVFQCDERGCARNFKTLRLLHSHILKRHEVNPTSYYEFVPPYGGRPSTNARHRCFSCGFIGADKKTVRVHAKKHQPFDERQNVIAVGVHHCNGTNLEVREQEACTENYHKPRDHITSPKTCHQSSKPSASLEPDTTSPEAQSHVSPTSPEREFINDEQLVDMPEFVGLEDDSPPPYESEPADVSKFGHLADNSPPPIVCQPGDIQEFEYANSPHGSQSGRAQNENDAPMSGSDSDSDDREGQSPRTFSCIYCEYTTVVEEWYHKHVASHLSNPLPYSRMYCTECSYSTGSEKYVLFHMATTHGIRNPEFFRSGEKRYTCRLCRHTVELRICMESHIKEKHKSEKKIVANPKEKKVMEFKCDECDKCYKALGLLSSHVRKIHNIRFPLYCHKFIQGSKNSKLACFCCKKTITKRTHVYQHYTPKQRRAPYLYKCPLKRANVKCRFSCKKRSEITEHYQCEHDEVVNYYEKHVDTYACINCRFFSNSQDVFISGMHSCKNKRIFQEQRAEDASLVD